MELSNLPDIAPFLVDIVVKLIPQGSSSDFWAWKLCERVEVETIGHENERVEDECGDCTCS